MTTTRVMAPPSSAQAAAVRYDRMFYSGMAVLILLIVLAGFAPTYYLRLFTTEGPTVTISGSPFTRLLHLHGLLFTAWVVLFLLQAMLVATRRVKLHMRLGIAGAALAAVMVVVGVRTGVAAAKAGAAPPGVDPLAFLVVPLGDIALFAVFAGSALWLRRNREAHKRLMLLASISLLVAAVARLPGLLPLGPLVFFGLTYLLIAGGVIYDIFSRRKVHPVYIWGGLLMVVFVPGRLALSGTAIWRSFAEYLTR